MTRLFAPTFVVVLVAVPLACSSSASGGGTVIASDAASDTGAIADSIGGGAADSGSGSSDSASGSTDAAGVDSVGATSGGADVGGADVGGADVGGNPGCSSAKVTLKSAGKISGKNLDFPDICEGRKTGDTLQLSLKSGAFTFEWEALTSESPRIFVKAANMKSGVPMPIGDNVEIQVPRSAPESGCTTKSASPPADIGTATLTWDGETPGSSYTFSAKGKAYCYGSSSGGSSWDDFDLTIEGKL